MSNQSNLVPRRISLDDAYNTAENNFALNVDMLLDQIGRLLKDKNKSYGNSALDPVRIFSKLDSTEQLLIRIDDKLSRLARGNEYPGDDTIVDLLGYLVLLLIARQDDESTS